MNSQKFIFFQFNDLVNVNITFRTIMTPDKSIRVYPGVRPIDGRPFEKVQVGDSTLDNVDRFCYLGDMLSAGGGCMAAAIARTGSAWGKFRELLPLLTDRDLPLKLKGSLFSSVVRSSMLHATETWPMSSAALHRLCRNDRAMIRWMCGVKLADKPSTEEMHKKLDLCDLAVVIRQRRLRWFGHVMRSSSEINRVRTMPIPGKRGPGHPRKTWDECVKLDLTVCGLSASTTGDIPLWRSSVKNCRLEPTPQRGSAPKSVAEPRASQFFLCSPSADWAELCSPERVRVRGLFERVRRLFVRVRGLFSDMIPQNYDLHVHFI